MADTDSTFIFVATYPDEAAAQADVEREHHDKYTDSDGQHGDGAGLGRQGDQGELDDQCRTHEGQMI